MGAYAELDSLVALQFKAGGFSLKHNQAIKQFQNTEAKQRVLILLTAGSRMPPRKAAEIAEQNGIAIHVVGLGDPRATGEDKVDYNALNGIAKATGGQVFHGENRVERFTVRSLRLVVSVYVPNYFTGSPEFPEFEMENAIVVLRQDRPENSNTQIGGKTYAGITETYVLLSPAGGCFPSSAGADCRALRYRPTEEYPGESDIADSFVSRRCPVRGRWSRLFSANHQPAQCSKSGHAHLNIFE